MKSLSTFGRSVFFVFFSLLFGLGSSFAANPISGPRGLALDAKGNLYVANQNADQVLVYTPVYIQTNTISQNVISPTGVAIDPKGEIWVANFSGSITEYSPKGVQDPARTITNGILAPEAIATDGLGDIWVVNDYVNLTVYPAFGSYPIHTYPANDFVYGVATHEMWIASGSNTEVGQTEISNDLVGMPGPYVTWTADTGFCLAYDAPGNLYMGNLDGSVVEAKLSGSVVKLLTLSYAPTGVAADSARGRIYVANQNGNSVEVYNMSGKLLTTLH